MAALLGAINLGLVNNSEEDLLWHHTSRHRSHELFWKTHVRDPSLQVLDNHNNSKDDPDNSEDLKHEWIHGWCNPHWVGEGFKRRGLGVIIQAQKREPCEKNGKVI
eukprot:c37453_g1_i1 orf=110-427(+)